jgi:hypothetical protein
MRIALLTILMLLTGGMTTYVNAQKKLNVTMRGDSVLLEKKFQFTATVRESKSGTLVQMRAPDSSLQAMLIIIPQDTQLRFSGRFAKLDQMYDCLYPKMELLTLYESYIRNGVMVEGVAQEKGLKAYCDERKLELRQIPKRQVAKPGVAGQDSILKARAEQKMKAMVQIEITNSASVPVTVMSGRPGPVKEGKQTYSEKREEIIPAGQKIAFTAFDGELICIIAIDKTEKDCRKVTHEMKSLSIVPEGDAFGK